MCTGGLHSKQDGSDCSKRLTCIISEKFDELVLSFCNYVEDENVNITKLKLALKGIVRQPTIYEDDETVTYDDIKKSNDVSFILLIVRSYCTFFNFKFLGKLIGLVKYRAGEQMMEEYKKDFNEYVKAISISEIPHGVGMDREDCDHFCVKLDESFKSCRAFYIDILKSDLCKILNIKELRLYIANTGNGSIRIIFQVADTIGNEFPLKEDSIKALSNLVYEDAKILRIGYNGIVYVIDDTSDG